MATATPKRFEDKVRKPRTKVWKTAMSLTPGPDMMDLLLLPNPPKRVLAMREAWKFNEPVVIKSVESVPWDIFQEPTPVQANGLEYVSVKQVNYIIREAKNECLKCGETFKPALDFHHRDPLSKLFEISNFTRKDQAMRRRTMQELFDEIAKCDVLCATCHRKVEHGGFNGNC